MRPPRVGAPGSGYPPQQVKSLPVGGGIVWVSVFVCRQLFFPEKFCTRNPTHPDRTPPDAPYSNPLYSNLTYPDPI